MRRLKKVIGVLMLSFVFLLLSGCGGGGAESAVKGMYKAGFDHDMGKFQDYYRHLYGELDDDDLEEIADDLAEEVMAADGINNIKIKALNRDDVVFDIVEELDDEYGKNWAIVLVDSALEKDSAYAWLMKEVDGDYLVLDVFDDDKEDIEEELLK